MTERSDASSFDMPPPLRAPHLLAEVLNKSLNAILVHRDGKLLYVNQAYADLNGYKDPAEAIAKHEVARAVHPDDVPLVRERIAKRLRGEESTAHYEFRIIRRDGGVIWVECLASTIDWEDGPALVGFYHDVTPRKRAEEALRRSERLFSTVFANSPDSMFLSRLEDGTILDANAEFVRRRGLARAQVIGATEVALGLWDSADEREQVMELLRSRGRVAEMRRTSRAPDGDLRELSVCADLLRVNGEELVLYISRDVTEQVRAQARIAHMAHHDPLTGLANRILFHSRLEAALREPRGASVLCLDLDRFKEVNDLFGHAVGDAVLRQVAGRLCAGVRDRDTVARLGGDEFAIIHSGALSGAAVALAERTIRRLSQPYEVDGRSILIGVSIGIASAPRDAREPADLLRCADLALNRAKHTARGGAVTFRAEIAREEAARSRLELELRRAVSRREFTLNYQPLVDLRSRRTVGAEALLRWNHPERGQIGPDAFIRVAEEAGLIVPLGRWVLLRACTDAAGWPGQCKVAVNISPVQLRQETLIDDVRIALQRSALPPERLELEVTESVVLQESKETLETLHELKRMGISLALDDFGTGYSSMSALVRFPFDRVKIDRSFVAGLGTRPDCVAVVRAVTGLAISLGLAVTAEGVETEQQLALLTAEGLGHAQGFLFGRAVGQEEIAALCCRPIGEPVAA